MEVYVRFDGMRKILYLIDRNLFKILGNVMILSPIYLTFEGIKMII